MRKPIKAQKPIKKVVTRRDWSEDDKITVRELIEVLKTFDQDMPICVGISKNGKVSEDYSFAVADADDHVFFATFG